MVRSTPSLHVRRGAISVVTQRRGKTKERSHRAGRPGSWKTADPKGACPWRGWANERSSRCPKRSLSLTRSTWRHARGVAQSRIWRGALDAVKRSTERGRSDGRTPPRQFPDAWEQRRDQDFPRLMELVRCCCRDGLHCIFIDGVALDCWRPMGYRG